MKEMIQFGESSVSSFVCDFMGFICSLVITQRSWAAQAHRKGSLRLLIPSIMKGHTVILTHRTRVHGLCPPGDIFEL